MYNVNPPSLKKNIILCTRLPDHIIRLNLRTDKFTLALAFAQHHIKDIGSFIAKYRAREAFRGLFQARSVF